MRAIGMAIAIGIGVAACGKGERQAPPPLPSITEEWTDDFERSDLGDDWHVTGQGYTLVNGSVNARGAYNHPLWLRRPLPPDAAVELDVVSQSPDGDIKVELYGDGHSFDPDKGGYLSTGYVFVMGGWKNSKSLIARKDEHGKDVVERGDVKVEPGKRYHWKLVRKGGEITWYVDDMQSPFLRLTDAQPLAGPGHAHFAINNWQTDTWFDNLRVAPLAP